MSTFTERLAALGQAVGRGHLIGAVEVDQIYAHYQHEGLDFEHPDGGEAMYLSTPLFAKGASTYMAELASRAITEKGTDIHDAMRDNMEDLSTEVYLRAPWEFADLRASGHPTVHVNGSVIYDRRPNVHRLGPDELAEKSRLRELFEPNRYAKGRGRR